MCPGATLKWCGSLTAALEVVQKYSCNVVFLLGRNDSRWRRSRTQKPLEIAFLAFLLIIYAWWVDSPVWPRWEPTGRMSDWLEIWLLWQQAGKCCKSGPTALSSGHNQEMHHLLIILIISLTEIRCIFCFFSFFFVHKLKGFHYFILASF